MRDYKEDLRKIGLSEELINHPSFDFIIKIDSWYNNNEYIITQLDDRIIVRKIGENQNYAMIKKESDNSVIIGINGLSYDIRLEKDGVLKVYETEHHDMFHTIVTQRRFAANGLEMYKETTIHLYPPHDNTVVERWSREPNGYITNVSKRVFHFDENGLPVFTDSIRGYVNVDLRYPSLSTPVVVEQIPYLAPGPTANKYNYELTDTSMTPEAVEVITNGMNDNSEEERRRFENYTNNPLATDESDYSFLGIKTSTRTM